MKRLFITALLICGFFHVSHAQKNIILEQKEGSITFVVDKNRPSPDGKLVLKGGKKLAEAILNDENIQKSNHRVVATSFGGQKLCYAGKDVFFRCLIEAYAHHRPFVISPDMVWMLISQGFARYVNAHPEEMRDKLVSHDGVMDLSVMSAGSSDSSEADWAKLLESFKEQIDQHTKGNIGSLMTADFSTTGTTERIASQITLMESVKSYFRFHEFSAACGIPSITLKGTPDDWRHVAEKTDALGQIGLMEWTGSLKPVLEEFIKASEGNPDQKFWQTIVKKKRVRELESGGGCGDGGMPTELDGWMLLFFPDANGKTHEKVTKNWSMPTERVRVGFKRHIVNPAGGEIENTITMELIAGFVGFELDTQTYTVIPKIGWLVREEDNENDTFKELEEMDKQGAVRIRVYEVPTALKKLKHIKNLNLEFIGKVLLPDWMDSLSIDEFLLKGKMTEDEKEAIRRRFSNVKFY